ncbi:MAG: 50S ribosomal protein L15 [Bacteroidota bacterium]|nr:50S ribosomal protein L15 [Bacteroidota bacterium]
MELYNLKPAKGSIHKEKRIARGEGSGHGGTATKGHKGMKSRSGASVKIGFEGGQTPMQRRLPKIGFKNIFRVEYVVLNLDQLEHYATKFSVSEFSFETLRKFKICGKTDKIKILGGGELTTPLKLHVHACSATAQTKIQNAGGSVVII